MAEVMNSLFGITPESLMAQREQALQTQAQQYAQADPFQRASASIYRGANQLGGAIGGMLGAQDPEMMRLQQRQSMLQNIDLTNPESLKQGIQAAMQSKDYQLVSELTNRYEAANKNALNTRVQESIITKNTAEKNAASTPADIAKAQRIAAIKAGIPAYKAAGDDQTVKLLEDELNALLPAAKAPDFGDKRESIAGELYENKTFAQLTPSQKAVVNKRVQDEAKETTPKYTTTNELRMPPDIVGAVNAADKATEKESALLDSARLAKTLINETVKTNNSQTWEAARTTIAKTVGENKLSNEDIRRTGVDPRLVQGALDWVNKKIEGVPNADIQKQLFVLGSVLENNAASRYDAKINRFRGAAEAAKFPGNPSTYFPRASERSGGQGTTGNVIEWSSMGSNQKK
jgi:hypothetical protein